MRLDQELVRRGLCESRQEAQECIEKKSVYVDGILCEKRTKQVTDTTIIVVTETRKFVSRGGEKLEGIILQLFPTRALQEQNVSGMTALDIGSSTGGFTDCLLRYGSTSVTAVDVGTMQLHPKLRDDTRVVLYENTDIRSFNHTEKFEIIVADVSFIALEKIIDTVVSFGRKGAKVFLLIKPQFEVGHGNTKKGIVKESKLVLQILEKYQKIAHTKNLINIQTYPCIIQGTDGNQEYFLYGELAK